MNLRKKTLLILGLILIGAVTVLLGLSYTVLIGSYSTSEEEAMHSSIGGAVKAIDYEMSLIMLKCGDWARWDETYQFLLDEDPAYIERNLNADTINNLDIDLFLFINESRHVVYASGYNKTTSLNSPLPEEDVKKILSESFFFSHDQLVSSRQGILPVGSIPVMLVSEPVLRSTYEGPSSGYLVFGKYLDEYEIRKLSDITSINLTILPGSMFPGSGKTGDNNQGPVLNTHMSEVILPVGQNTITGYTGLPGVIGNDSFILQVTSDRRIYNQGLATIGSFIVFLIVIGLLLIASVLYFLDHLVLKRLNILITRARTRNSSPDLAEDELLRNRDELSELSKALTPVFNDYTRSIEDLRKSELRYHELADIVQHTRAGIMTGKSGTIDVINPAYAHMHGYQPDEIRNIPADSLFSPQMRKQFSDCLKKAEIKGHIVFEAEHIHRDGTIFPTLNDLTVIKNEEGGTRYWILNVQDITEHRLAWKILMESESLRESHRQLRDVISRLPDATFVVDKDGWVIIWNTAMERLIGITADSIIGRGQSEYSVPFYGKKRPFLVDYVLDPSLDPKGNYPDIIRHGDTISVEEFLPDTVNGPMFLSSVASPLYNANGKIIGAIESIRNISDRKRAEEALQKTNEKLNLLSSITRHDIRNQITVFIGVLPILENVSQDPEIIEIIHMLERAAGAIRAQIEFTRDYQDLGVRAPEWSDVGKILDAISSEGHNEGITILNNLHGLFIYADPLLERVFFNLVDNAIRHGGEISRITASYVKEDPGVIISFADDGTGIPDDIKEMVFERGYGSNTGLGLFLVRQILSITGISVRETGQSGTGARFELLIPEGNYRIEHPSG